MCVCEIERERERERLCDVGESKKEREYSPKCDNLVRVCMAGNALGPGQPEVRQLELPRLRDEQVLRFHVPEQTLSSDAC